MSYIKIILFLLFSATASSQAEWRALAERAGFFGKYSLGASYEWNQTQAVDLLIGTYEVADASYYQANFAYRYSRWEVPFYEHNWRPIQFGGFIVTSLDNGRFFITSPSKYPYPEYYDETALRWGAELGSTFTFKNRFAIGYCLRIFDNGLIAIYNNSNRDLQYYISSGLSLQYAF